MSTCRPPCSIRDKDANHLFHDQPILHRSDPLGAPGDFTRFGYGIPDQSCLSPYVYQNPDTSPDSETNLILGTFPQFAYIALTPCFL
jgi:hypothetical protein